jgi:hypothetical protein
MLSSCGCYHGIIEGSTISVPCAGVCNRHFHPKCVKFDDKILTYLKSVPELSWKCRECVKTCFSVDQTELQKFLSEKRSDMLNELNTVFDALKSDILKITTDKVKQSEGSDEQVSVQSYSQVLQNKTQPAVIIKPKQTDRSAVDTKRDINAKINPIEAQLSISKIKNIKDGGVLVGFSSMEDNARFKKVA